ncbi:hypothetical protein FYK55_25935 [Roseiconus nitratireducens]|uniref:Uncharacterized protein n=1 Tax=Roseiconus nitratireducens TaxID=2605748 RepID=A0A5M6CWW6_9BACT|nr:hypothetical protein [Roseiconus nitratireducens]KAA5538880.1 hypothetical protein FYK55_25935 [Roseiconus nitratireducens]
MESNHSQGNWLPAASLESPKQRQQMGGVRAIAVSDLSAIAEQLHGNHVIVMPRLFVDFIQQRNVLFPK